MAVKRTELKAWWGHRYGNSSSSHNSASSSSNSSSSSSSECTAQRAADTRVFQEQVIMLS
jgi:hypothetical protein